MDTLRFRKIYLLAKKARFPDCIRRRIAYEGTSYRDDDDDDHDDDERPRCRPLRVLRDEADADDDDDEMMLTQGHPRAIRTP